MSILLENAMIIAIHIMILLIFRDFQTLSSEAMFRTYSLAITIYFLSSVIADKFDEDQYGVKYADDCEICKIVSNEITLLLSESEGKHEVLETGYSVTKEKKKTKVRFSVGLYLMCGNNYFKNILKWHHLYLFNHFLISVC